MKRWLLSIMGVVIVCGLSTAGYAQEDELDEDGLDAGIEEEEDYLIEDDVISDEEIGDEYGQEEEVDAPTGDAHGVETYWGMENLEEVEKGFFFNMRLGPRMHLMGDMASGIGPGFALSPGLGYDVIPKLLSLELDGIFTTYSQDVYNVAPEDPANEQSLPSDFMAAGWQVAVNIQYFTTKRFEAIIGVTGGMLFTGMGLDDDTVYDENKEKIEDPTMDYFAGGRVGIEYYTGLRHFSIGLDLEVDYVINAESLALSIYPMMKYTF